MGSQKSYYFHVATEAPKHGVIGSDFSVTSCLRGYAVFKNARFARTSSTCSG
jgi:hypothetical protein